MCKSRNTGQLYVQIITYPLDGTEAAEFALQISFFYIVTESRNEKGSKRVASSLGILRRVI